MDENQNSQYEAAPSGTNSNTKHSVEIILILDEKLAVSKDFLDALCAQVQSVIDGLDPSASYTLRTLCGEDFWGRLDPMDHIVAGRCMTHLIRAGKLPLVCEGKTPQNAKLYRLK